MLKVTTKTTHFVNYSEVEGFIAESYGIKNFEITESPNDTDYTFNVTAEPLDEYTAPKVAEKISQGWAEHYYIGSILDDLCGKGLLPAGTYVMRVCW